MDMRSKVASLPKTTIVGLVWAVTCYAQAKGYVGQDEANLVSATFLALGVTANAYSGKFSKNAP